MWLQYEHVIWLKRHWWGNRDVEASESQLSLTPRELSECV